MSNALCFEDVEVDQTLMRLKKGPMTTTHIMRWSSAIENWHRIHYDQRFAIDHDKLPDVLVNGSWKQHILAQVMKDGLGPDGMAVEDQVSLRQDECRWRHDLRRSQGYGKAGPWRTWLSDLPAFP